MKWKQYFKHQDYFASMSRVYIGPVTLLRCLCLMPHGEFPWCLLFTIRIPIHTEVTVHGFRIWTDSPQYNIHHAAAHTLSQEIPYPRPAMPGKAKQNEKRFKSICLLKVNTPLLPK